METKTKHCYLKNRSKAIRLIKSLSPVTKTDEFQKELANSCDGELIKLFFYSGGYDLPSDWMLNFTFNFIKELQAYKAIRFCGIVSFLSEEDYAILEKYLCKSSRCGCCVNSSSCFPNGTMSFSFTTSKYYFSKKKNNSVSHFRKNYPLVAKKIKFPACPKNKVFEITVLKFNDKVAIAID